MANGHTFSFHESHIRCDLDEGFVITPDAALALIHAIKRFSVEHNCKRVLVAAAISPKAVDIDQFEAFKLASTLADLIPGARLAYCWPDLRTDTQNHLFATAAGNRGVIIGNFNEPEAAMQWLLAPTTVAST